jgi:hypothetical protein
MKIEKDTRKEPQEKRTLLEDLKIGDVFCFSDTTVERAISDGRIYINTLPCTDISDCVAINLYTGAHNFLNG